MEIDENISLMDGHYLRVSTNDQNTENQRLAVLEYATKNKLTN